MITAVPCPLVNYSSSVDGFALSYYECLPGNFNASVPHRLLVYLHGLAGDETAPKAGGYLTVVNSTWVIAAAERGFVFIVPNTRTGSGFYIDSPYTGPQEQDIWDAVRTEEARVNVSGLYIFGSSMGSMGAWLLSGHHPGVVAGIGAVLSFSDYFEEYAYASSGNPNASIPTLLASISNGELPSQSALASRLWTYLSTPRFAPENYSGIRLYIVHGGDDVLSENSLSLWPYLQANNSVLNTTCLVAASVGEPANCTEPFLTLSALHPGQYPFRYVFEPTAGHTADELNITDMFNFWDGAVSTGVYLSSLAGTPVPPSSPLLGFATDPEGCGGFSLGGRTYGSGSLAGVPAGTYPVTALACPGRSDAVVTAAGDGGSYSPATGTVSVNGTLVLVATYPPLPPPPPTFSLGVVVDPGACGPLAVNGSTFGNGSSAQLAAGSYAVTAPACPGWSFTAWAVAGNASVSSATANPTEVTVRGNASVAATYAPASPPPPPVEYRLELEVSPASCGAVLHLGPSTYANGSVVELIAGTYPISAGPCPPSVFANWTTLGNLTVVGSGLEVRGAGLLVAQYGRAGSPPPASSPSSGPSVPLPLLAVGGAGAVAAIGGAVAVYLRSRRPPAFAAPQGT